MKKKEQVPFYFKLVLMAFGLFTIANLTFDPTISVLGWLALFAAGYTYFWDMPNLPKEGNWD